MYKPNTQAHIRYEVPNSLQYKNIRKRARTIFPKDNLFILRELWTHTKRFKCFYRKLKVTTSRVL